MVNKRFYTATIIFFLIGLGTCLQPVQAQNDNTYFIANQLLDQRNYEQAFDLFKKLHKKNPENFLFLEKATECLINLKQYDKAIAMTRSPVSRQYYPAQAGIHRGEIYHTRGDTTKAYDIWSTIKEQYSDNLQVYLYLARAMRDRRAFDRSIETYKEAARLFSDATALSNELANTYLLAGRYEESVQEYLRLIKENPDRINYVQSTLLRFDDEYLYDVAILEIDDFLKDLPDRHPSHRSLHQLEVWLLMERELYERALATAKNYEEAHSRVTYTLYGLGSKLLSEGKFELAEQAYRYYVDNNVYAAKRQSMEELGTVYIEWANYLADFNLANSQKRDSLYKQAYLMLGNLQREAPDYQHLDRVLITQSELALDYLHDPVKANAYLQKLEQRADTSNLAQRAYIQARIHLYNRDYARARIAFTKSNKQERIGELAQKTRYYLALTDFYAGDYEFAKIQLNALERQTTSYFANDAVQLRVWIQDGLQADTSGQILAPFARAVELFSQGETDSALVHLAPVVKSGSFHPLSDEALLELSSHVTLGSFQITYRLLTRFLTTNGKFSPLRERLMWEKARLADQVITNNLAISEDLQHKSSSLHNAFSNSKALANSTLPSSAEELIGLYEDIILTFPKGFYASFARSRIQELQNVQT